MCQIIRNITSACGHREPRVSHLACQFDGNGAKPPATDPLCLLYDNCWEFGYVRQINFSMNGLCSACYIAKKKDRIEVDGIEVDAAYHSRRAQELIAESEARARLENLPIKYINHVTAVALKRLDIAFKDEQMEEHHFAMLLKIIVGLPFLDKDRLVEKFAGKIEERCKEKFGAEKVKDFYELSKEYRNFGDDFRKGLKDPSVLDKAEKKKKEK